MVNIYFKIFLLGNIFICFRLLGGGGPLNDKNILPLLKFLKTNLTASMKHFSLILNWYFSSNIFLFQENIV